MNSFGSGGLNSECNSCVDDSNSLSEVAIMINDIRNSESAHCAVPGGLSARKALSVNMIGIDSIIEGPMEEMNSVDEEDDEDLQAIFRSACQSRGQ